MSRTRRNVAFAALAAVGTAATLVLSGCGGSSVPADLSLVSAPPNGGPVNGETAPALGQTLVFRAAVTNGGKPFGYLYGTKVLVAMPGEFGAPKDAGVYQNDLDFVLPDGEITVTGTQLYPLTGLHSTKGVRPAVRAISGGTGAYTGVTGTLTSMMLTGGYRTQVFHFVAGK